MPEETLSIKIVDLIGFNMTAVEMVVPSLQLTVRELINLRVYNEYTSAKLAFESSAHRVKEIRKELGGKPESQFVWMDSPGKLDLESSWEIEAEKACVGFQNGQYMILAAGRQLSELDEELILEPEGEVQFIRLIPLIGG